MNKILLIAIIAILILGGGGLLVANQQSKKTEEAKMMQEDSSMKKDQFESSAKVDGRYVEYSKTVLDQSADKRRVIYFYANWCPTCIPADANFKANSGKIPEDVIVIRVNYNDSDTDQEEKDLAKKYNITYQHTFVQIDSQGSEIKKWNGGGLNELLQNLQ